MQRAGPVAALINTLLAAGAGLEVVHKAQGVRQELLICTIPDSSLVSDSTCVGWDLPRNQKDLYGEEWDL